MGGDEGTGMKYGRRLLGGLLLGVEQRRGFMVSGPLWSLREKTRQRKRLMVRTYCILYPLTF